MVRKSTDELIAEINAELEKNAGKAWVNGSGWHPGKPAGQLKSGDVTLWSGGAKAVVSKILDETKKAVLVEFEEEGEFYPRWLARGRVIAVESPVSSDEI